MDVRNSCRCKEIERFKIRITDLFDQIMINIVLLVIAQRIVGSHNSTKDLHNSSIHKSHHESSLVYWISMILEFSKSVSGCDSSIIMNDFWKSIHNSIIKLSNSNVDFHNWFIRHHTCITILWGIYVES